MFVCEYVRVYVCVCACLGTRVPFMCFAFVCAQAASFDANNCYGGFNNSSVSILSPPLNLRDQYSLLPLTLGPHTSILLQTCQRRGVGRQCLSYSTALNTSPHTSLHTPYEGPASYGPVCLGLRSSLRAEQSASETI